MFDLVLRWLFLCVYEVKRDRKNIHSVGGLIFRTVLLMLAPKETILGL